MSRNRDSFINDKKQQKGKLYFLFAVFLAVLLPADVYAGHNVCSIKADDAVVWVRVFDLDPDGNVKHGYNSGYYARRILWRGMLKKGQAQEIRSSNGEISYEYEASSDNRSYGANLASCSHGELISVP
jgi:hypothetical protein